LQKRSVNQALEYFLSASAIEQGSTAPSPDADTVELGTMGPVPKLQLAPKWEPLPELNESILHWWKASSMKSLWMSTDSNNRQKDIAHVVYDILSSSQCNDSPRIALVDVSRTRSTIWPLIRGFTNVFPQYKEEIKSHPCPPLSSYFDAFSKRPSSFGVSGKWDVSPRPSGANTHVRFYFIIHVFSLVDDPAREWSACLFVGQSKAHISVSHEKTQPTVETPRVHRHP
jgi:hypothetical protein